MSLFDLLLQGVKLRGREELPQGDLQPVAELFDSDYAGILTFLVEHTVNGGRSHARYVCKSIDRNVPLLAKLYDPLRNGFLGIHSHYCAFASQRHPFSAVFAGFVCKIAAAVPAAKAKSAGKSFAFHDYPFAIYRY